MMKPGADGKSALGIVIDLLKTVVQGRLIQGGKDELGVCFYNTVSEPPFFLCLVLTNDANLDSAARHALRTNPRTRMDFQAHPNPNHV
eukprot:1383440-Amorphochlora_amoeboformis.AAC.1